MQLKILTLPSVYILEACKYIRRNLDQLPTNADKVHSVSRRRNLLYVPRQRLAKSKKSVHIMGLKLYNILNDDIKQSPSDAIFAKKLKALLLQMACYSIEDFFDNCRSSTHSKT